MRGQFPEKPKKLRVKHLFNNIIIIKKWFNTTTLFFTLLTLIMWYASIFLILFYAFGTKYLETVVFQLLFLALLLLALPSGILLHYFTLAKWLNQTYIRAYPDEIIVNKTPVHWVDDKKVFPITKIKRFYSQKLVNRMSYKNLSSVFRLILYSLETDSREPFEVRFIDLNGTDKQLVVGTSEEALFFEKTLEIYFNIEDEPQEGELGSETSSIINRNNY